MLLGSNLAEHCWKSLLDCGGQDGSSATRSALSAVGASELARILRVCPHRGSWQALAAYFDLHELSGSSVCCLDQTLNKIWLESPTHATLQQFGAWRQVVQAYTCPVASCAFLLYLALYLSLSLSLSLSCPARENPIVFRQDRWSVELLQKVFIFKSKVYLEDVHSSRLKASNQLGFLCPA